MDVIVLKHYTCLECGREHIQAVRMPLEDWQVFRDGLEKTGQRYTKVVRGAATHHWHLNDVCLECHTRYIGSELEPEVQDLVVPPVPQLMTWRQRLKRSLRHLFP